MENKDENINNRKYKAVEDDLFARLENPFAETKDKIWDEIFEGVEQSVEIKSKVRVVSFTKMRIVAAVLIPIIGIAFFMRFYTKTIDCSRGEHISYILPDDSKVNLNAQTLISYKPYWWYFSRELSLEGEAFFDVKKGEKFKVVSKSGTTEVLGTSFNIYARNNNYKVFCKTGKVKVSSTDANVELIIEPGEIAVLDNKNKKGNVENVVAEDILYWKENKFNFSSKPLDDVFNVLELQYDVSIEVELNDLSDYLYTGYFVKSKSVEKSLDLICKSFNLTFVKLSNKKYKVLQNK